MLSRLCDTVRKDQRISVENKARFLSSFGPRFEKALALVKRGKVHRYGFRPSGRVVWSVRGKTGEYQVIPESNFCNCEDYYFRVMEKKKAVCYHIIAQKVAASLRRYSDFAMRDGDYEKITSKWKRSALSEIP